LPVRRCFVDTRRHFGDTSSGAARPNGAVAAEIARFSSRTTSEPDSPFNKRAASHETDP
jgi:hypothetical protein